MRFRKPLIGVTCPACTEAYSANENEVRDDVLRCPHCGHEREIEWPPSFEESLGCGPLAGAAFVLLALAAAAGGGGILGILLGIVLGLGIPAGLAVLLYHLLRVRDE